MQRVRKLRERRAVPLRGGDVWIYLGPATEVRIAALAPRPTSQKPRSQAVTLDDGRTIAEATLHRRIANQRREITRLLAIEAAWLFEGMAKAEAALAAQRAGLETRVICTQCGGKKWFGDVPCSACNAMGESTVLNR